MYIGAGLGIIDYAPTGVRLGQSQPTCVFADEREAADRACWAGATIHGLGARDVPIADGRLEGLDACTMKDLPLCPSAPSCMDASTAGLIAGCIAGSYMDVEHRNWCESYYGPLYYAQASLCGQGALPPVPACLDDQAAAGRLYCKDYGFTGPDPGMNALCWLAQKDAGWWQDLQSAPTCRELQPPPALPPQYPSQPPPQPPPPMTLPPSLPTPFPLPEPPPEHHEARMAGVGSILLLLAVAGGGYYAYRRMRR